MTVNAIVTDVRIVPDGVAYTIDCPGLMALGAADISVLQYDSSGTAVAVPAYSVTGIGDPAGITVTNDGNVPWTADPAGVVVVSRATTPLQQTDPEDFGPEDADVIEATYDRPILLAQEAQRQRQRSIRLHAMDDGVLGTLPPLALLLGKVLAITDQGDLTGLDNVPLNPAVAVSALMQLALTDATAGAFLNRMGFSAFVQGIRGSVDAPGHLTALGFSAFVQGVRGAVDAAAFRTAIGVASDWVVGSNIASAAAIDLDSVAGGAVPGDARGLTGAGTAIATITGTQRFVRLIANEDGIKLTHDPAKIVSRTASDIVMRNGDAVTLGRTAAGVWRELSFEAAPTWKSANIAMAVGILPVIPHYLGKRIGDVRLCAACIANDLGWTPADFPAGSRTVIGANTFNNAGVSFIIDDTNVKPVIAAGGPTIINKGTLGSGNPTLANWQFWLEIDARC